MKLLVMGDIHGNLIALEHVIEKYGPEVDKIVCHGDVVNYGPWSDECVQLLHDKNISSLRGNHEEAFIDGVYSGKNILVHQFFNHTFPRFTEFAEIKKYEKTITVNEYSIIHTLNNTYYFPDTDIDDLVLCRNTVIGHSHYPFVKKANDGFQFINTGSIGQNRKNLDIAQFVIIDTDKNSVEIVSSNYDTAPLITEMKIQQYPVECVDYYLSKL